MDSRFLPREHLATHWIAMMVWWNHEPFPLLSPGMTGKKRRSKLFDLWCTVQFFKIKLYAFQRTSSDFNKNQSMEGIEIFSQLWLLVPSSKAYPKASSKAYPKVNHFNKIEDYISLENYKFEFLNIILIIEDIQDSDKQHRFFFFFFFLTPMNQEATVNCFWH